MAASSKRLSALISSAFAALTLASASPAGAAVARPAITPKLNDSVRYWMSQFTGEYRERFGQFLERGAVYRQLIEKILRQNRVPAELYYLAMIESGFVFDARSHASAVGMWQFMRPTAKLYGLRSDHEVDERLDPIRSTAAAARYLRDLKRQFGSWELAMAAYNAGAGRVRRAMREGKSRDYWTLVRRGALPAETSRYVPQFHAAMLIARDPRAHGFAPAVCETRFPEVHKARVPRAMPLEVVARERRVPLEALRAVNPHLLNEATPSGRGRYELWVPRQLMRVAAQSRDRG